jgi:hypothetical protein
MSSECDDHVVCSGDNGEHDMKQEKEKSENDFDFEKQS